MQIIITVPDDYEKDVAEVLMDIATDLLDPNLGPRYVAQYATLDLGE